MKQERLFHFNPFTIKEWEDGQVKEQYDILERSLTNGDTPFELANDINTFADMGYLVGEMIARYSESVSIMENNIKVAFATETYKERDYYFKTHDDKPPAIAYFESKARAKLVEEYSDMARAESTLQRFKFAYTSIESKQNALKKKLDSFKYEQ